MEKHFLTWRLVSREEMVAVENMAHKEPFVHGVLAKLRRAVATYELEMVVSNVPKQLQTLVLRKYWRPFAEKLMTNMLMWGFSPFQINKLHVRDLLAGGEGEEDSDGEDGKETPPEKAVGESETSSNLPKTVAVPTMPDLSQYEVYVCVDYQRIERVVCIPKRGASLLIGQATGTVFPVHVVVSRHYSPNSETGRLRSSLSALLSSYNAFKLHDRFATVAAHSMAHPPIVYEHANIGTERTGDVAERVAATLVSGENILLDQDHKERVQIQNNAQIQLEESRQTFNQSLQEASSARSQYYSASAVDDEFRVPLTHSVQDSGYLLPPGVKMAAHVPQAQMAADYYKRVDHFKMAVAVCLGLPPSFVGLGPGRNTTIAGENEAHDFLETITATARELETLMNEVHDVVMMAPGEFRLPVYSASAKETLVTALDLGCITHETFRREFRRLTGFEIADHDTRLTEIPVQGGLATLSQIENDTKNLELKNEAIRSQAAAASAAAANKDAGAVGGGGGGGGGGAPDIPIPKELPKNPTSSGKVAIRILDQYRQQKKPRVSE